MISENDDRMTLTDSDDELEMVFSSPGERSIYIDMYVDKMSCGGAASFIMCLSDSQIDKLAKYLNDFIKRNKTKGVTK